MLREMRFSSAAARFSAFSAFPAALSTAAVSRSSCFCPPSTCPTSAISRALPTAEPRGSANHSKRHPGRLGGNVPRRP